MNSTKSLRNVAAVLAATVFAGGAALAQQPAPTIIEGVPSKPAPSGQISTEHTRGEIRQEARRANAIGEADKGGQVAAKVGEQNDALGAYMASDLTRAEVQAQVRGQTDRIGGEGDDLGRMGTM
jgi:hypothetical protein